MTAAQVTVPEQSFIRHGKRRARPSARRVRVQVASRPHSFFCARRCRGGWSPSRVELIDAARGSGVMCNHTGTDPAHSRLGMVPVEAHESEMA